MSIPLRRRSISRLLMVLGVVLCVRFYFTHLSSPPPSSPDHLNPYEILEHNVLERVTRPEKAFNVQKHKFLQARMGRDERDDLLGDIVRNGLRDFWERFQKPQ